MNKHRVIEGRWWIEGDDKPPHYGALSFDPEKGLELNVKVVQARTNEALLCEMVKGKDLAPSVICGADQDDQPITFFGINQWRWSKAKGLDTYKIGGQVALLNYRGKSWEGASFRVVSLRLTLLDKWMNRRLQFDRTEGGLVQDDHLVLRFKASEILEFEVGSGVRLRIDGTTLRGASTEENCFGWNHKVWFLFQEPQPAQTILDDYAQVFLRLLCLLTGERVYFEEFAFWASDPFAPSEKCPATSYELLKNNPGISDSERARHASRMVACFEEIALDFGLILKRWLECHERLEPVIDLSFAVISNWVLMDQSRFLLLAQALEVFHSRSRQFPSTESPEDIHEQRLKAILDEASPKHRKWLTYKLRFSNQKSLQRRIVDVTGSCPGEAARLTAQMKDFAETVRDSRNYYTHYSQSLLKSGKVAKGLELRRIMFALHDLLEVCLLKELGIQGKPIQRILERNADA